MANDPRHSQPLSRSQLLAAEHGPGVASTDDELRVALIYPNNYHVGMSSLGFQIAWQLINDTPGVRAERFFHDTIGQGSIETGLAPGQFDVIALSGAYEMDDPNILDILEAAGLPLTAHERRDGQWPLVLMGGVLVSVNRLPLYPFIDVFCHGEAESILPGLTRTLLEARRAGLSRAETLASIATLPGLEVTAGARLGAGLPPAPGQEELSERLARSGANMAEYLPGDPTPWPTPPPPARALMTMLEGDAPASTRLLTPHTEFANMGLIDLARGCPNHCTFCWIGHNAPAYRVRPLEAVLRHARELERFTHRIGLVASAVGAHPQIDEICEGLLARGMKISYSSLRMEEVTPTMIRTLAAGGQKSVTIAPEAGDLRVRRLLGKRISDERIFEIVEQVFGLGAESLKMYFMVGVPTETDAEALEIAAFTEKIRAIMLRWARGRGRIGEIAINLGVFVPKPRLPLNHLEPVPLAAVKKRLGKVVRALHRIPNVRVNASSPDLARAQSVLSVGGIGAAAYLHIVRQCDGNWREAGRLWERSGLAEAATPPAA